MCERTTTDGAYATASLTENEALDMLEERGIDFQIVDGRIEALSIITEKHAPGGFVGKWVKIVYRRDWLTGFLGPNIHRKD